MIITTNQTNQDQSVLIVNQNIDECRIIEKWLQPYRIKIDYTNKPIEAVSMVQQKHYTLIFIDMDSNEEIGGFETIWLLSSYTKGENIILMSCDITSTSATKALNYGVEQWIHKPLNRLDTLEVIEETLDGHHSSSEKLWSLPVSILNRFFRKWKREVISHS